MNEGGENVESCIHRWGVVVGYLNADNLTPPVLFCQSPNPVILTLTTRTIFVKCPECNARLQSELARLRPAPL